jgi:ATP-dependent Clp protease protease subunit
MEMTVPYIIEKNKDGERSYDLYSRLLRDRIIFIGGEFNRELANSTVAQLLFLESFDSDKDIFMYINSPGGHIEAMYAVYDTMRYIKPNITTIGFGEVCSAGSFVLAAGTKGKRFCLPNTNIMIHELSGGAGGKFNEIETKYTHVKKIHEKMAKHYSLMTGQKVSKIKKDMERDYYMTPEEAKEYGLIDAIQEKRE